MESEPDYDTQVIAKTIQDFIDNLGAEQRLHPNLYANELAKLITDITDLRVYDMRKRAAQVVAFTHISRSVVNAIIELPIIKPQTDDTCPVCGERAPHTGTKPKDCLL